MGPVLNETQLDKKRTKTAKFQNKIIFENQYIPIMKTIRCQLKSSYRIIVIHTSI